MKRALEDVMEDKTESRKVKGERTYRRNREKKGKTTVKGRQIYFKWEGKGLEMEKGTGPRLKRRRKKKKKITDKSDEEKREGEELEKRKGNGGDDREWEGEAKMMAKRKKKGEHIVRQFISKPHRGGRRETSTKEKRKGRGRKPKKGEGDGE